MIFPEGTRSRSWEMLPFKDGAFRLAIESGAPILPIAVAGTRNAMAKGSFRFLPARAIAQLLEPIPTTGMTLAEAAAGRIAIPGPETTAYLLLSLAAPALGETVEIRYDRILAAVETGEVDAGLIIHESRFTYRDHGLELVADRSRDRRRCDEQPDERVGELA